MSVPSRRCSSLALAGLLLVAASAVDCSRRSAETSAPPDGRSASALGWSAVTSPAIARAGHSATLLGDGRVLVAGGSADERAEILDPRVSPMTSTPLAMLEARSHHTATMLPSGDVLLAGGDGGTSAEIFHPTTNSFSRTTGDLRVARSGASAVRMPNGRVLLVGGGPVNDTTSELYDPSSGTFTPGPQRNVGGDGPVVLLANTQVLFLGATGADLLDLGGQKWTQVDGLAPSLARAAVRINGGNVLVSTTEAGVNVTGPTTFQIYDATASTFGPAAGGAQVAGAGPGMTGILLPTGAVLFAGTSASTGTSNAVLYDPTTDAFTADDPTTTSHHDQTATILANGDVLLVGGDQPGADVRPWGGAVLPADTGIAMTTPRTDAVAVRLHDGGVLLAGGWSHVPTSAVMAWSTAETFDPASKTFTATANAMSVARRAPSGVVLTSGKVLVAGGGDVDETPLASADVYDPTTRQFHAVGAMGAARRGHALTRLPSGHVLVTGGCSSFPCAAELFDPDAERFQSLLASPNDDRDDHGAVLLPDGEVLIVGGPTSEIYDPASQTFRKTTSQPSSARSGRTARFLPSGLVFAAGAATLTIELYDPTTGAWTVVSPPMTFAPLSMTWALTPLGDVLLTGGIRTSGNGAESRMARFDPLTAFLAPPAVVYDPGFGRSVPAAAINSGAHLLVAGGDQGGGSVLGPVRSDALLYGDGAGPASRPSLDGVPTKTMVGGKTYTITGQRLVSRGQDTPLAFWESDTGDAVIPMPVYGFTSTTFTVVAPSTAYHGPGFIEVVTAGVASVALPVALDPGQQGALCRYDAECSSGHCADGFCCDARCDGDCEACSFRRKLPSLAPSAAVGPDTLDGSCKPISPGKDPDQRCLASQGQACDDDAACRQSPKTLSCVASICCDSPCVGACLSCDVPGKVGTCSAVSACGQSCDGDHTLTTKPPVDCSPYKCDGAACKKTCASVRDCVGGAVCTLDGVCAPPADLVLEHPGLLGCAAAPGRPGGGGGPCLVALVALAGLALGRRRLRC